MRTMEYRPAPSLRDVWKSGTEIDQARGAVSSYAVARRSLYVPRSRRWMRRTSLRQMGGNFLRNPYTMSGTAVACAATRFAMSGFAISGTETGLFAARFVYVLPRNEKVLVIATVSFAFPGVLHATADADVLLQAYPFDSVSLVSSTNLSKYNLQASGACLRTPYALPGTDAVYGTTRARHPGTNVAYGAARTLLAVQY
eukprot:641702-Rhodomonas_salina.3